MRTSAWVKHCASGPSSIMVKGFIKCKLNPNIVNLGVAENYTTLDLLMPRIRERSEMTMDDLSKYATDDMFLCRAAASLFEAHFGMKNVNPENVVIGVGIASILERFAFAVCEPGDVILIAKPCYGAFEPDLYPCGATIEFIDLDDLPESPPVNAKILVLTDPGNPIGERVHNPEAVLKWAHKVPGLHVLVDEVYAMSGRDGKPFESIMELECADPARVHECYGLSKDWGLAGLHVGFFYSRNDEMVKSMKAVHGSCRVGLDTQWIAAKVIGEPEFRDKYIATMRERITASEKKACALLDKLGVPYKTSPNSLFIMLDMRAVMTEASTEGELALWDDLLDTYSVYVIPSAVAFRNKEFGWFRLCFSLGDDMVCDGITRIGKAYSDKKAQ